MGSAFICRKGGFDLGDLEFELVDSPCTFKVRNYDLRKGVYIVFCVSTDSAGLFDCNNTAVFVDGERVSNDGRDSHKIAMEVDSEGRSRLSGFSSFATTAFRIKTKWEG